MKADEMTFSKSGFVRTYVLKFVLMLLATFHVSKFRFSARYFRFWRVCWMKSARSFFGGSGEGLSPLSFVHAVNTLAPQIRVAAITH